MINLKKRIYRYSLVVVVTSFFMSCRMLWIPQSTKKDFTYCYNGQRTGLDTLIKMDGHYVFTLSYIVQQVNPPVAVEKSTQFKVGFYEDGTFLYRYECGEGFWGRYIIQTDTIKAQFLHPPGSMSWIKGEVWFEILDSTTIEELVLKYRGKVTNDEAASYWKNHDEIVLSHGKFIPESDLPNPDYSWLKNESWYWCSEEQYDEWVQELKNK